MAQRKEDEEVGENQETFEKMAGRFTDNSDLFIKNETLRIFYEAEDCAVKLEALKVLAAQH